MKDVSTCKIPSIVVSNFDKPAEHEQAFGIFHVLFGELSGVQKQHCSRTVFGMQQLSDINSNVDQQMHFKIPSYTSSRKKLTPVISFQL